MSFNALSIAKLGIGFGAIAISSIGLLSPTPIPGSTGSSGGGRASIAWKSPVTETRNLASILEEDEIILHVIMHSVIRGLL